jgi:PEP-CTERM motif
MKTVCLAIALICVANADTIHPYGVPSPGVFAMAGSGAAGGGGGGGGVFTIDNCGAASNCFVSIGAAGPLGSASSGTADPGNTSSGKSSANFGLIKVYADFFDSTGGLHGHAAGIADAGWVDRYTISNALLTGQHGVFTFLMHVDGHLFAGDPGGASGFALGRTVDTGTPNYGFARGGQANALPGDYQETINQDLSISVDFTFGTSFDMMLRALASANLFGVGDSLLGGSSGITDFYSTIYWAGVQSVTVGGAPVSSYTLSAASGTNYNQSFAPVNAVPEPGSLSLFAVAAAAVLWRLRRKR